MSTGINDRDETDEEAATTLRAELAVLREENRRLREEYARARKSEYRRAALVLAGAGVLSVLAGLVVTTAQTVLFALGGTGLFVGVLTYYLTPERLVPATVGRDVYTTMAETGASVVAELDLQDDRVYVPTDRGSPEARLFVPQHAEYAVPDEAALADAFVVGDDESERGFSTRATGDALFERFEEARTGEFGPDPAAMARQLSEALVEQFELIEGTAVDAGDGRLTVEVTGSTYGRVDRFDHPVPSLLASGLAHGLDEPVTLEVTRSDGDAGALVTCRWDDDTVD